MSLSQSTFTVQLALLGLQYSFLYLVCSTACPTWVTDSFPYLGYSIACLTWFTVQPPLLVLQYSLPYTWFTVQLGLLTTVTVHPYTGEGG